MDGFLKLAVSVGLVLATNYSLAAPPPIEAFGRKPALLDVDMNPAGTRLAWITEEGDKPFVIIHDLATAKTLRRVGVPAGVKLWSVKWANDETLLVEQTFTQTVDVDYRLTQEYQRWIAMEATGTENRMLLMNDEARQWSPGSHVLQVRTKSPGKIHMASWDWLATRYREETGTRLSGKRSDSGWVYNVYEVDLRSGDGRVLESGTQYTTDWVVDEAGTLFVRSDYRPKEDEYVISVKDGGSWRKIYDVKNCHQLGLVGFSPDKKNLLALGRACNEQITKLWSMPVDGSAPTVLYADAALDLEHAFADPLDGSLLGVGLGGPLQPIHWLDPQWEKRNLALQKSFNAKWVSVVSRSQDGTKLIARVEDEHLPATYYLVDYGAKKADIINEAYPQLVGVKLADVRQFNYEARDKYALLAYLTVPVGVPEKNLPLVVMPHGGPHSRDDPGFDWLSQFLASRGYAVIQPQFRGSTGFGIEHQNAGDRQWGLRMQDDVTDAVRAVIDAGIADAKRVCIVGWSYGGYAALAGAAFTPDLYACAVSIAGISDLPSQIGFDIKGSWGRESDVFHDLRRQIGEPTDAAVIAKSPARAAASVRAPILLIHGADDTVVPIIQSQRMARALAAAGKPFELIELKNEDHWMWTKSSSRIRTLTELDRFLGKHIGTLRPTTAAN
ncbi:MAG TPA: alpha/beta fold hydrolase [Steroidobacteraceae bacterium]|nr:alpha/beta fold hydrolase [Steroidobacteraceae bacterium]